MVSLKPIVEVLSIFIAMLCLAMFLPVIVDLRTENYKDALAFSVSAAMGLFISINLYFTNRNSEQKLTTKHAFILTSLTYIVLPFFAALPFCFSVLNLSFTDAYFEAMSGLTSCGASVIENLIVVSPGILLWRAMLNWLGGIGVVLLAMAVLPILKVGGMQLFKTESSDRSDKILPRAGQIAGHTAAIYVAATLVCSFFLWIFGMEMFDAVTQSMTTISTGGFGNYDSSITVFNSLKIEIVLIITMIFSSLPFTIYIKMLVGDFKSLYKDEQVRLFMFILFIACISSAMWLNYSHHRPFWDSLRYVTFNITSAASTTGLSIGNIDDLGSYPVFWLIFITFAGGCTGSTAGGVKMFRFQILYQEVIASMKQLIHPHGIFKSRYKNRLVSDNVAMGVMLFFFIYVASFIFFVAILSFDGVEFFASARAVANSLAAAGLPIGNEYVSYKPLPTISKWALSAAMLIGRLEFFTILVLFLPGAWRKY